MKTLTLNGHTFLEEVYDFLESANRRSDSYGEFWSKVEKSKYDISEAEMDAAWDYFND